MFNDAFIHRARQIQVLELPIAYRRIRLSQAVPCFAREILLQEELTHCKSPPTAARSEVSSASASLTNLDISRPDYSRSPSSKHFFRPSMLSMEVISGAGPSIRR